MKSHKQQEQKLGDERRQFIQAIGVGVPSLVAAVGALATSTGLAGSLLVSTSAEADEGKKSGASGKGAPKGRKDSHASHADHALPAAVSKLALEAADCAVKGELCLSHCIELLSTGDTSLGECAKLTVEMVAICKATATMASINSKYLKATAKLAADICNACAEECKKHAEHHATCKVCMEACLSCAKACQAV
jgi:Cys-rich four helix bundle protein (predicted Tat secretion target)